jgi:nitroreductase
MEFLEVVQTRRSVRAYKPDPIRIDVLRRVFDAARAAPSANNEQPWLFLLIKDAAQRRRLAELAADQMFIAEAPVVVVCCGRRYVDRWSWIGPHMYLVDCAIAMDHLTLAARDAGLGTCWIGAFDHEAIKQAVPVPPGHDVVMLTPLGYPAARDAFHESRTRRPLSDIAPGL